MLQIVDIGYDTISQLGSRLAQNDDFLFVSANGYNIFNGLVNVYYKNFTTNSKGKIESFIHSVIKSPYNLNSNFGVSSVYATKEFLFIGGISDYIYHGVVYVYKYRENLDRWLLIQKLAAPYSKPVLGFGNYIFYSDNLNLLNIGTFYGEIYTFSYNDYYEKFVHEDILQPTTKLDVNNIMRCDTYNNIILWHLSSLQVWNSRLNNWLTITSITNCDYINQIEVENKNMIVSCNNQIFIYNILYDGKNNIQDFTRNQIIYNLDTLFATNFYIGDNILLVSGTNSIYYYTKENSWELKNTFVVPNDEINYDYMIQQVNSYMIVGNFEFDAMKGCIWSYQLFEPEKHVNITVLNNTDTSSINNANNILLKQLGLSLTLLLFGMMATIFTAIFCYYCVQMLTPPIDEKKKKEEEEYSPYKVHSYVGYSETDYIPVYPYPYPYQNQNLYQNQNQIPYYYYYPTTPTILNTPINAFNNNIDNNKKSEKIEYVSSKEKIASYKGYTYDYIKSQYNEKIEPILRDIKKNI